MGTPLTEESLDLSCASGLAYLRARAQIGCDQESHRHRKSDNRPLEMSTVDGDIKLEYRDDFGRVQTPKEAFRAISWKFHGKVPGRKKHGKAYSATGERNEVEEYGSYDSAADIESASTCPNCRCETLHGVVWRQRKVRSKRCMSLLLVTVLEMTCFVMYYL